MRMPTMTDANRTAGPAAVLAATDRPLPGRRPPGEGEARATNGRLSGKSALVTGAASGIGRAIALAFADEGASVLATDIDASALGLLNAERPDLAVRRLNVLDPRAIETLATEVGAVDILFNGAGFVHDGTILDCGDGDWGFSFDLNVRSMYRMIRAFLPAMLDNGGGSIINMASVAGCAKGMPRRFVYNATKAAVIGLTKSVAVDFIDRGIRCNAICAGPVDTPSLRRRLVTTGDGGTDADFISAQPMGRLGRPEEIAALAVYLASDESAFTTGTTPVADGGAAL